ITEKYVYILPWVVKIDLSCDDLGSANTKLFNAINADIAFMEPSVLSSILWAMARLGYQWNNLPSYLQQSLVNALKSATGQMDAQCISNILWALARLYFGNHANQQDIQVVVQSLFNVVPVGMVSDPVLGNQLVLAFYYFRNSVKNITFACDVYEQKKPITTESPAQCDILLQISTTLQCDLLHEAVVCGCTVDAVFGNFVIEIDGPHHQKHYQRLTDIFQNTLLSQSGITSIRIDLSAYYASSREDRIQWIQTLAEVLKGNISPTSLSQIKGVKVTMGIEEILSNNEQKASDIALNPYAKIFVPSLRFFPSATNGNIRSNVQLGAINGTNKKIG
ncbi:MAG TPA: hypothetical protein VHD33_01465, partial [Legionellaceae bacterium]|nr:hypothetical protein [Legionellaceae bacterium]